MPTSWELQNGLDPKVDDSNLDPDGDGRPNKQEFTDHRDPQVRDNP